MKQGEKVPHYVRKIEAMWQTGALPRTAGYHQISVAHDAWCGVFQGEWCNCNPDIQLKWSQPAAAQN